MTLPDEIAAAARLIADAVRHEISFSDASKCRPTCRACLGERAAIAEITTLVEPLTRELAEAQDDLRFIGQQLPAMLEFMEWGAFKGALLEDGTFKRTIDAARTAERGEGEK